MKLVYPEWTEQFDFSKSLIQVLNIENPVYFRKIVSEMVAQNESGEGRFILSKGENILDMSKRADVILSPLRLDMENKKILNVIQKELLQIANEDEYIETREIIGQIQQYFLNIASHLKFEVSMDDDIPLTQLFKLANIKPYTEGESTASRLVDYIFLMRNAFNTELFIGINMRAFFSQEELSAFYRTLQSKGICFLFVENLGEKTRIDGESWLTIDEDLCEI